MTTAKEKAGYSYIGLIVIVSIIILLAASLFPALYRVKESGRRAKCMRNLKNKGKDHS